MMPAAVRTLPVLLVLCALLTGARSPAAAEPVPPAAARGPASPVGEVPVVVHGWRPPLTPYGPGHRGVDLAAAPGEPVRSFAAGRVAFAGRVDGRGVVSVLLDGTGTPPLRITYQPVDPLVRRGARVAAGDVVGRLGPGPWHCAGACLHWGLLRGRVYLDPLSLVPPWMLGRGPSRLLPMSGPAPTGAGRVPFAPGAAPASAGSLFSVPALRAGPWRPRRR